jgi:hypothetical protein
MSYFLFPLRFRATVLVKRGLLQISVIYVNFVKNSVSVVGNQHADNRRVLTYNRLTVWGASKFLPPLETPPAPVRHFQPHPLGPQTYNVQQFAQLIRLSIL